MKKFKKLVSVMMIVGLVFSSSAIVTFADSSQQYEEPDVYVLNYANQDIENYEEWDAKRFIFSPYRTDITIHNYVTGEDEVWNWCSASILNMVKINEIDGREADYAYASIPVYCADAVTDGVPGYKYRRINIEDSEYISLEDARRVRAILTNSFPHIEDMDVITANVNEWIKDNNLGEKFGEVKNLNFYEVTSATQSVIWVIINDGKMDVEDLYEGTDEHSAAGQASYSVYPYEKGTYPKGENTPNNINAVAAYLMDLAPVGQQVSLINEDAFISHNVRYRETSDGTYTANIKVKVNAEVKGESALVLKALLGENANSELVVAEEVELKDGENEYTLKVKGVTEDSVIKLAIDGTQDAIDGDVYLFEPCDENNDGQSRPESQTMIGFDTSVLNVHAMISLEVQIDESTIEDPDGTGETDDPSDKPDDGGGIGEGDNDKEKTPDKKITEAKTGDDFNVLIPVVLMIVAAMAGTTIFIVRRHNC